MNKKEMSVNFHRSKYNCAQSVACCYADELGYNQETIFKVAEAFGGGMGTFGTCGAVSAMAMVIGMKFSDGSLDDPATKAKCYELMSEATEKFKKKNGSTICREIKGMDTGVVLRSCNGCIEDATEILDKLLSL